MNKYFIFQVFICSQIGIGEKESFDGKITFQIKIYFMSKFQILPHFCLHIFIFLATVGAFTPQGPFTDPVGCSLTFLLTWPNLKLIRKKHVKYSSIGIAPTGEIFFQPLARGALALRCPTPTGYQPILGSPNLYLT